jgi:hypothetical protein
VNQKGLKVGDFVFDNSILGSLSPLIVTNVSKHKLKSEKRWDSISATELSTGKSNTYYDAYHNLRKIKSVVTHLRYNALVNTSVSIINNNKYCWVHELFEQMKISICSDIVHRMGEFHDPWRTYKEKIDNRTWQFYNINLPDKSGKIKIGLPYSREDGGYYGHLYYQLLDNNNKPLSEVGNVYDVLRLTSYYPITMSESNMNRS